jgi:hypothetical protein
MRKTRAADLFCHNIGGKYWSTSAQMRKTRAADLFCHGAARHNGPQRFSAADR